MANQVDALWINRNLCADLIDERIDVGNIIYLLAVFITT